MKRIAVLLLTVSLVGCGGSDGAEPESSPLPDENPILTVTEPLDHTVATPEVTVTASCSDDRGDCDIIILEDPVSPSATNELSRVVDLSEFEGQLISLSVVAVDSAGREVVEGRLVYIEPSTRLVNERAFPAPVVDFDGQRALLEHAIDLFSDLSIFEMASGSEEDIDVPAHFQVEEAYLTPTGAVFAGLLEGDVNLPEAYDWNHSLLVELGPGGASLQVAGDYATWVSVFDVELLRRQFSTMTDVLVHDLSTPGGHSVASNGVVAFSAITSTEGQDQIMKFDAGVVTALTADADRDNRHPRTDGQGVVYYKKGAAGYEIAFHDSTGEIILTAPGEFPQPEPDSDYAIAGGWVAFNVPVDPTRSHVWTRDPSSTLLQRTALDGASRIETLAPDGEVMVVTHEAQPADGGVDARQLGTGMEHKDRRHLVYHHRPLGVRGPLVSRCTGTEHAANIL